LRGEAASPRRIPAGATASCLGSYPHPGSDGTAEMIRETASTYHITLRDPDGWTFEIDCAADQTILDAVIEAGLRLPEMCSQGWCLTCAGRLLKGKWITPSLDGTSSRMRRAATSSCVPPGRSPTV